MAQARWGEFYRGKAGLGRRSKGETTTQGCSVEKQVVCIGEQKQKRTIHQNERKREKRNNPLSLALFLHISRTESKWGKEGRRRREKKV